MYCLGQPTRIQITSFDSFSRSTNLSNAASLTFNARAAWEIDLCSLSSFKTVSDAGMPDSASSFLNLLGYAMTEPLLSMLH